jgi:colanic acid/amylovoran biosynthesis glycosyltransferase
MRKVLVFKETLLPPSETFILAQMTALTRYQPILTGLERSDPSLPLQQDTLLLSNRAGVLASLRAKLYRKSGFAPLFHRRAGKFHPDLLHAHFASGGRTAVPLARQLGLPLLVTLHGSDVTVRSSKKDANKRLADEACLFLCVSEFIRDRALEAGFPAEKLLIHYIGIDRALFAPSSLLERPKGVLFTGRLVEKKGCEYLLRAMQLVQKARADCDVTIIGDGPLRPALQELARDLKVSCDFRGVQSAAAVREALRKTRLFCVPSVTAMNGDSEGLGMVFAEAQAIGIPIVSSEHGGIPEVVINGTTGLLAPERNHEALAEALSTLLTDDHLWQRFRIAALQHIQQNFDLKTQTSLLEDIYSKISSRS